MTYEVDGSRIFRIRAHNNTVFLHTEDGIISKDLWIGKITQGMMKLSFEELPVDIRNELFKCNNTWIELS